MSKLPIIMQIVKKDYWIDMEGKIRTNDWLDLDKCLDVCNKINEIFNAYKPKSLNLLKK